MEKVYGRMLPGYLQGRIQKRNNLRSRDIYPTTIIEGSFSSDVAKEITFYTTGTSYEDKLALGTPNGREELLYNDVSSIECNWKMVIQLVKV